MQPVRLGNHELLVRLASGGAANVFLVRDFSAPKSNRLLALKTLLPSLASNEDFLQMFFAEARIASRLKHENIVSITGFGQVEGIHCLAMEYVFGASLSQVLRASARAKRPLTVGVLLRITAAVCDALHFAHEMEDELGEPMGLVHRDVTPQNILISFNGVPKLTDFGIAKATGRGWETQAGIVKGKFSYMSPEQALGKKVDRRSDIFGTGIVLWEALTGRDLFRGSTPMEVLTAIREQKIEAPSKVVSGLTPIVDPIVMRALRRSPRDRYQDSREMRDSILELIERAGVDIDAETISKELYAIYGEEIGKRAVELKKASGGKANLEELAKVLGGMPLNQQQHLPMIPGGVTHPDPLGLFSDHEPVNGVETDAMTSMERPTTEQTPEESWDDSATGEHLEVVSRWNEGSVEAPDEDELLAMLSEEDATVGLLPKEFAAKFGAGLELPEDEGGIVSYQEDEATLGMGNHRVDVMDDYPSVSDAWTPPGLKTIEAEARPDLRRDSSVWGGSRISPSEFESDGGDIPLRSKPRAPSLLIEDAVPSEAHLSPSSSMRPHSFRGGPSMELDSAEMRIEGFSSQSMARAEKLSTGITVSWPVAFFVSVSLFFSGLVLGYVAGMVQLLKDFLSY